MTRKFIRTTDVVFLEDQIVGDVEKSHEPQSSSEKIHIILTLVSTPVVYNNYEGAEEDNNNDSTKPVEKALPKPHAPPIEP